MSKYRAVTSLLNDYPWSWGMISTWHQSMAIGRTLHADELPGFLVEEFDLRESTTLVRFFIFVSEIKGGKIVKQDLIQLEHNVSLGKIREALHGQKHAECLCMVETDHHNSHSISYHLPPRGQRTFTEFLKTLK